MPRRARRARLALPGVPLHRIQRGNNRQACFFADEDYRGYLDWLTEYAGNPGFLLCLVCYTDVLFL